MKNLNVHNDPQLLVEAIFESARSGDLSLLKDLGDPQGQGDEDIRRICAIASAREQELRGFRSYFMTGKVVGEPKIDGDKAQVDFLFGPEGNLEEKMNLIRRNGKWYLLSF